MVKVHLKEVKSHKAYKIDLYKSDIDKLYITGRSVTLQSRKLSELLEIRDSFTSAILNEHDKINTLTIENVRVKILNLKG